MRNNFYYLKKLNKIYWAIFLSSALILGSLYYWTGKNIFLYILLVICGWIFMFIEQQYTGVKYNYHSFTDGEENSSISFFF